MGRTEDDTADVIGGIAIFLGAAWRL